MKYGRAGLLAVALIIAAVAAIASGREDATEMTGSATDVASSVSLLVDISERRLYVRQNGERIASYRVGVGTSSHPTPRGSFKVRHIIWNPRWVPPNEKWARDKKPRGPGDPLNPMGKVKIFFDEPDYYIHGTNEPETVGRAVSHGCIRMRNEDVIAVARQVMKAGGAHRPASWFRRVLNRVRSSQEVYMDQAVSLTVTS